MIVSTAAPGLVTFGEVQLCIPVVYLYNNASTLT
jgi:hypothetical protein